jgi:acetyl-CoA acyltransferase 2
MTQTASSIEQNASEVRLDGARGARASREIVLVGGCRTAFGSFGGSLKDFTATDLGVFAAKGALERSHLAPAEVEHVIFGNALQTSNDAIYLARHVGLRSGVPESAPAVTVNRLCGSGFEAIIQAARLLLTGEAEVVLAGGTESMSMAPHVIHGARWGLPLGKAPMTDLLWAALFDPYAGYSMAETAENLAEEYQLTREEVDSFAAESQRRAKEAIGDGRFKEEIVPIEIQEKKRTRIFDTDEHPRPDTTSEILAKLPPYFKKDGLVTAGNASGIVDGASAVIVTTRERAQRAGAEIQGVLVGWGLAGVQPRIMGIGPAPASRGALAATELNLDEVDLIEINEAFAPQTLAVVKELSVDRSRLNVNGGAIALGHPLAASGTRLTITVLNELNRRGGGLGLATACIGGGQGAAVIVRAEGNGQGPNAASTSG